MNLLRKMYEEMQAVRDRDYQGVAPYVHLDPSKGQDKLEMDSFLNEHFPNCVETKKANVEIFTNLSETVRDLDIGVLVRYNDPEMGDGALYFRLNAMNDATLAELLKQRNVPGEAHLHVWGKDAQQAMERLRAYFQPIEQEHVEQTLKTKQYGTIHGKDGALYTEIEVTNKLGIHARPAALVAKSAMGYGAQVKIYDLKTGQVVNAKSIFGVMLLAATKGTPLRIEASGDNARKALESMVELFENNFNEE